MRRPPFDYVPGHYYQTKYSSKNIPIFEKSGLLDECEIVNGIELKYSEPADAISPKQYFNTHHIPPHKRPILKAKLYHKASAFPIKEFNLETKSSYLIGRISINKISNGIYSSRNSILDIGIPDRSYSKQHCVIQFREIKGRLCAYIMDLESVNGTSLNGISIPTRRYVELSNNDTISYQIEDDISADYEVLFQQG